MYKLKLAYAIFLFIFKKMDTSILLQVQWLGVCGPTSFCIKTKFGLALAIKYGCLM